jgi:hypothetical protein
MRTVSAVAPNISATAQIAPLLRSAGTAWRCADAFHVVAWATPSTWNGDAPGTQQLAVTR